MTVGVPFLVMWRAATGICGLTGQAGICTAGEVPLGVSLAVLKQLRRGGEIVRL
ncbi:MAG: hypothetical protein PVH62_02915 [Anaerolineae bacterium]